MRRSEGVRDAPMGTPTWVKIAVGLGVIAAGVVAVVLGFRGAVISWVVVFLEVGAALAFFGFLGIHDE